jgi:hypothetical protein
MAPGIVDQQRLAWNCARAFAATADTDRLYFWLCARVRELLGADQEAALYQSRLRLLNSGRPDAVQVEVAIWRARLVDLLSERPELSIALGMLVDDVRAGLKELALPVR